MTLALPGFSLVVESFHPPNNNQNPASSSSSVAASSAAAGSAGGTDGDGNNGGSNNQNDTSNAASGNGDAAAGSAAAAVGGGVSEDTLRALNRLVWSLPYFFIVLLLILHDYFYGIFVCIWITVALVTCNERLIAQVALKENRSIPAVVTFLVSTLLQMLLIYAIFHDDLLWNYLIFKSGPARPGSSSLPFLDVLWVIFISDSALKVLSITFKSIVLLVYTPKEFYIRKGRIYALIEAGILFYRSLIPIPVWVRFFSSPHYQMLVSIALIALYAAAKLRFVLVKLFRLLNAVRRTFSFEAQFGRYATPAEAVEAGNICSICRDDFSRPIVLSCDHIFCEACIEQWFERDSTCPLCRKEYENAKKSHTDGSTSLGFMIF